MKTPFNIPSSFFIMANGHEYVCVEHQTQTAPKAGAKRWYC